MNVKFSEVPALGRLAVENRIALIWQSGQSNSIGAQRADLRLEGEVPFFSSSPYTPYAHMLNTGLRGTLGQTVDPEDIVDFIPAVDELDPIGRGQVPGTSMMAQLARLNGLQGRHFDMVWRSHGKGGRHRAFSTALRR